MYIQKMPPVMERKDSSSSQFSCILSKPSPFLRNLVTDILSQCPVLEAQDPRSAPDLHS